ncbi:MAG: DUF11 domain-containing protein, partial [Anaerolineales bacterium]|nr:DUF11 domain-containing protein [Anaerolineales bacterium]
QSFVQTSVFTSQYQLVRLAPADYDGDGDVDLVASTNAIVAGSICPVMLYRNDGTGTFSGTIGLGDDLISAPSPQTECLSDYATAALGPGDFDEDGDVDLAIGVFPGTIQLLVNDSNGQVVTQTNPFGATPPITIETGLEYVPYDLVWGDFDQDGYPDLAAAFPLQREVRIYRNAAGTGLAPFNQILRTAAFMTPLSIDWGDFDGDGKLELLVADSPPRFYRYDEAQDRFVWVDALVLPRNSGPVWSARGADMSGGGTLDLLLSNRDGPSELFSTYAPMLKTRIVSVTTRKANSVAWGDYDHDLDGDLDLLFGSAAAPAVNSALYLNSAGTFATEVLLPPSGFGPHVVAFGDVTGEGLLDVAIGTPNRLQVYYNGATSALNWSTPSASPIQSLAWGDANDDGRLDLLVGRSDGSINLYLNQGGQLRVTPAFSATVGGEVRSLAWGDYDGDHYLDFAVGVFNGWVRVYRNTGGPLYPVDAWHFTQTWLSPDLAPTTAVAWADVNSDGHLDLAVGNYGAADTVWETVAGAFPAAATWTSAEISKTTSLAWGDWNNDGYPELAAGHDGEPDIVYANLKSAPGMPQLHPLWVSEERYETTGVAWGDRDGDGDLDLAISQKGAGWSGFYENTFAVPGHIVASTVEATQLPNPSPYLAVSRPGTTLDAYIYSSPERLSGPLVPTVTVQYTVYDPDASGVASTTLEYSVDGGSRWRPAQLADGSSELMTQTLETGSTNTFVWDAAADHAVGDDARLRVRVVPADPVGPFRQAVSSAVSPPFRVRGLGCTWPAGVSIRMTPEHPQPGDLVTFSGHIAQPGGPGSPRYQWDWGDGHSTGPLTVFTRTYTFPYNGTYLVTLKVTQLPECPIARPAYARIQVIVGTGKPAGILPMALWNYTAEQAASGAAASVPEAALEALGEDASDLDQAVSTPLPAIVRSASAGVAAVAADAAGQPADALRVTRYTLGVNSRPSVSQDGTRIAFWTTGRHTGQNNDGNVEIFLAEIQRDDTVRYTQVTSSTGSILAGFNLGPVLDDAGRRVAFYSDADLVGENPDRGFEVYLAEVGTTVAITQVSQAARGFSVLPDISGEGRFIAYVSNDDIYRADVAYTGAPTPTWAITTTRVTTLTREVGYNDQPSISRDGRFIAFVSDQDIVPGGNAEDNANREIFLAEIDASGRVTYTQVTNSLGGINDQPSVSGDGRRIVFLSDRDYTGDNPSGVRHIFFAEYVPATHSFIITQQISTGTDDKDQPSISADGLRIAYVSTGNGKLHLYDSVDPGSAEPEGIGSGNAYPAISANGTDIVYVSNWDVYRATYPLADLMVSKSVEPGEVGVGEQMTFTISVTNTGPTPATEVHLTDPLSRGLRALLPATDPDFTDDDNSALGFGGGSFTALTTWSSSGWLQMNSSTNPFKLPDDPRTGDAWADMSGNALLLHMDSLVDSLGLVGTPDTSGSDYRVFCFLGQCPSLVQGHTATDVALGFNGHMMPMTPPWGEADPLSNMGPGTWMMWVNRTTTNAGTLLCNADEGYHAWSIRTSSAGEIGIYGAVTGWDGIRLTRDIPGPGEWFHLAATWDGSQGPNGMRLYINGQEANYSTSGQTSFGYGATSSNPRIGYGCWSAMGLDYFQGALDEVAVFNRVLAADEIHTIYERQAPPRAAYFDSRVMTDTSGTGAWSSLAWMPYQPIGKELPDYGAAETGYLASNVDMTGTALLLHFNEPTGVSAFLDSSGQGNDGYCNGSACPTSGQSGRFDRAVRFDNVDDRISVGSGINLANSSFTLEAWAKRGSSGSYDWIIAQGGYIWWWMSQELLFGFSSDNRFVCGFDGNNLYTPSGYGDTEWHHWACTYNADTNVRVLYRDGVQVASDAPYADYQGTGTMYIGGSSQSYYYYYWGDDTYFHGLLDEVVVTKRALSSTEISDRYLRGMGRMSFQVRSCNSLSACDNHPFVGPDGTRGTFYSDEDNPLAAPPLFGLSVANNLYIQYRVYMDSYSADSPRLVSVTLEPRLKCQGQETVTCTLATDRAPLPVGGSITLRLPVEVVNSSVYLDSVMIAGNRSIVNTARVDGRESDHDVEDNQSAVAIRLKPVAVTGVTISGPDRGLFDTSYTFAATASPPNATPPIRYIWSATDLTETIEYTGELSHSVTLSWTVAGAKTITVTAINDAGIVTDTHSFVVENPRPSITAISPTARVVYDAGFTLLITGSHFAHDAVVRWGGVDRPTTYVSRTLLRATISASDLLTGAVVPVTVRNPAPGGGTSNAVNFTVNNPVPVISSVQPMTRTAGSSGFTLVVAGSNFVGSSVVRWGGANRTTTFV